MTTENKLSIYGTSHIFNMSSWEPRAGKTVSRLHLLMEEYGEGLLRGHLGTRTSIAGAEVPRIYKKIFGDSVKIGNKIIFSPARNAASFRKQ